MQISACGGLRFLLGVLHEKALNVANYIIQNIRYLIYFLEGLFQVVDLKHFFAGSFFLGLLHLQVLQLLYLFLVECLLVCVLEI